MHAGQEECTCNGHHHYRYCNEIQRSVLDRFTTDQVSVHLVSEAYNLKQFLQAVSSLCNKETTSTLFALSTEYRSSALTTINHRRLMDAPHPFIDTGHDWSKVCVF